VATDPHGFQVMLQRWPPDGPPGCTGVVDVPLSRPTRLLFAADPGALGDRDALAADVEAALHGQGGRAQVCGGPGGLECWATAEPAARNILAVVASGGPPSAPLEDFADEWLARVGFEAVGILPAGVNPDVVLPTALRSLNAILWQASPREALPELLDAVLLDTEDRRLFVSYARADGADLAEQVFEVLSQARFDVFLDRFSLAPGVDFLERIQDEILDKAMVVVVETAAALRSHWVGREVDIAVARGLGIAAINVDGSDGFREIAEDMRCRSAHRDTIRQFLLEQHRTQLLERREGLRQSVWQALVDVGVGPAAITDTAAGFAVRTPGGVRFVGISVRPADLHRFRLLGEQAGAAPAFLIHPQPAIHRRRRDLGWLSGISRVVEVDTGRIMHAAPTIAAP
jgi:TIR domain-containing protein